METKLCGRCHKPVSASLTTDDICRHCGNYWRSEDVSNSGSSTGEHPSNLSQTGLIIAVVVLGIIIILVALGLTKYLNNQRLAESFNTGSAIRESLARYADDAEGNLFPQKIENWSDLVSICNSSSSFYIGARLKPTGEAQGMNFRKYKATDGRRNYIIWLKVRGVPNDTKGKILEISPSGIKKITIQDLQK